MKKFTTLSQIERKNLIQKVAFELGMRFDIIEKDIWVCYVLEKLFSIEELKGKLVFKGGTCLSKAYGLIERFSEDIDLTIGRSYLNLKENLKKNRLSTDLVFYDDFDFQLQTFDVENSFNNFLEEFRKKDLEVELMEVNEKLTKT